MTRTTADSTPPPPADPLTAPTAERQSLLNSLRDVVVALDSRTQHPERAGEEAIAADASALRLAAVEHIGRLERDDPAR